MNAKRFTALALMFLLLLPALSPVAYAVQGTTGEAIITFYREDAGGPGGPGGNNGGGNAGGGLTGGSSNKDKDYFWDTDVLEDTVTILDPNSSVSSLGQLPKTGGSAVFPVLLMFAGASLLVAYGAAGKHSLA